MDLAELKQFVEKREWHSLQHLLSTVVDEARQRHDKAVEAYQKALAASQKRFRLRRRHRNKGKNGDPALVLPQYSSPFLVQSSSGRTALHWCLLDRATPNELLLFILRDAPACAAIPDRFQQLPMHLAVQRGHSIRVIAELMVTHPLAINQADLQQETPLDYAVAIAQRLSAKAVAEKQKEQEQRKNRVKKSTGSNTQSWAKPVGLELLEWQDGQDQRWSVVRYLLLGAASHKSTKLSVGGKQEKQQQPMLLEAMIHAAPPSVVSLLIAASTDLLQKGVALSCSALYLCISRKYPLPILQSLTNESHQDVKHVRDETGELIICI